MGATSTGRVFGGLEGTRNGELGRVVVDEKGRGELVGEIAWPIWEAVGRGIVVQREDAGERATEAERRDFRDDVVVGVVARSAGVWENEKIVCGCSGRRCGRSGKRWLARGCCERRQSTTSLLCQVAMHRCHGICDVTARLH